MASERKPKRRGLRVMIITLVIACGVCLPTYLAVTQVDREIAVLRTELKREGVNLRERSDPSARVAMSEVQEELDRIRGISKDDEEFFTNSEDVYRRLRDLKLDLYDGEDDLSLSALGLVNHCYSRARYYLGRDVSQTLDSLAMMGWLRSHLAPKGGDFTLSRVDMALAEIVAAWRDRPDLQLRAMDAVGVPHDPRMAMSYRLSRIIRMLNEDPFSWSWSYQELRRDLDSHFVARRMAREALKFAVNTLRNTPSRKASDLLRSMPALARSEEVQYYLTTTLDALISDLDAIATSEIVHLQCMAFIELRKGKLGIDAIPNREPFLDPYTGNTFQFLIGEEWIVITSAGPDGEFRQNADEQTDDIWSRFNLVTLP